MSDPQTAAARLAWNADRAWMAAMYPDWPMPAWSRAPAWRRRPYILDRRRGTVEPTIFEDGSHD
jgi:hypothetical protein